MAILPKNPNDGIDYSNSMLEEIYLAGGCFWGVQAYIRRIKGVAKTDVGYANGFTKNPTYEQVCNMNTGHAETVHVFYDPQILPLNKLLEYFFGIIDPTSLNKQGNDAGLQYRSGIYYNDKDSAIVANQFINSMQPKYNNKIVVEVMPLENYYEAEKYHQDYLEKNPNGYCHISF